MNLMFKCLECAGFVHGTCNADIEDVQDSRSADVESLNAESQLTTNWSANKKPCRVYFSADEQIS